VKPEILIERRAWDAIVEVAGVEPMREIGGLLLGWRHNRGVYVRNSVAVPDARARHTVYRRRYEPAAEVLEAALADLPTDSPVGYVGEWHSHPAATGPSWVDRLEMRRISKQRDGAVGLVVSAYDARAKTWRPAGLVARSGRTQRAHVVVRDEADT
jgi:proteasome lid subunit RPN8/RPN11